MALRGRLRPTEQQRLLLTCALGGDEAVARAWESLRADLDLDTLDHGGYGLLPQVYAGLVRAGVEDARLERLKGIYRKSWYGNQMLLSGLGRPLGALRAFDAEPLLLHGTALAPARYPELALRRIPFLDVAVLPGCEAEAVRSLARAGFHRHPDALPEGCFPSALTDRDGRLLFVHAGLPADMLVPGEPDGGQGAVWRRAVTVEAGGSWALVLDATDELLCACAAGPDVTAAPEPLWLADAAAVIRGGLVDWDALEQRAHERRVGLRLSAALSYLSGALGVRLPQEALLAGGPAGARESLAHRLYASRVRGTGRLAAHLRA